jgi:hypothetical protein
MLIVSQSNDVSFEETRIESSKKNISRASRCSIPRRYGENRIGGHVGQQVCGQTIAMDCRLPEEYEEVTEGYLLPGDEIGHENPLLNFEQSTSLVQNKFATDRPNPKKLPQSPTVVPSLSSQWKLNLWKTKHQYKYRRVSGQAEDDPVVPSNIEQTTPGAKCSERDPNRMQTIGNERTDIDRDGLQDDMKVPSNQNGTTFCAYDNRSIIDCPVGAVDRDDSFHRERSIDEPLLQKSSGESNSRENAFEQRREDRNPSPLSSVRRTEMMAFASMYECQERDPPPRDKVQLSSSRGYSPPLENPALEVYSKSLEKREIDALAATEHIGDKVASNSVRIIRESELLILNLCTFSQDEESTSTVGSVEARPLLKIRTIVCDCRCNKSRRKPQSKISNHEFKGLIKSGQERSVRKNCHGKYASIEAIPSIMSVDFPLQDSSSIIDHDKGKIQADLDELDALIYKMARMDNIQVPVESQLSAILEGDEDVTQEKSTISFKTTVHSAISKTQKLAQYLKRDGEATYDYDGTMFLAANSMESLTRSKDGEIEDIDFFAHVETTRPTVPNPIDMSTWIDNPPLEFTSNFHTKDEKRDDQSQQGDDNINIENIKRLRHHSRNRTVVLKDNEIVVPIASEDASVDISEITEDFLQIPVDSALYKQAMQIFKDAELELAEAEERELELVEGEERVQSSHVNPSNDAHATAIDGAWADDLKYIASVQF